MQISLMMKCDSKNILLKPTALWGGTASCLSGLGA